MSDLDTFESPGDHIATFETDELTARCPFNFGGPDFYDLVIRYEPDELAVESKSLKVWLQSFRDTEISAEALAVEIHDSVADAIEPDALYVRLEQARRGGIEESVEVREEVRR